MTVSDQPAAPNAAPSGPPNGDDAGLLRSSLVMAIGTVVSRITGFVRSLFLVWALGSALFADTFSLANALPTSVYILVAGGALNAVFVPQLVRAMKQDNDGGEGFGNRLLTLTTLVLAGATVLTVAAAPLLVRLFSSDSLLQPENRPYFELAVTFARYCLPQIFFMGLFVIIGQILNARGRFGPMMWAPIVNNLVSIAVFVSFIVVSDARTPDEITSGETALLGLGSTLGIVLQSAVLLPVLRKAGFRLRARFDFRGGGIGKAAKLAIWTVALVLVNQIWFVAATRLTTGAAAEANRLFGAEGDGYGLTPYLQAFLIMQLPHAVITVSLVAALLPRISRLAADGDTDQVRSDVSHALRVISVAILPAVAAFLALGPHLTLGLYRLSGDMSERAAMFIGFVLMGFAPALLGFCSHYTLLRGFYAYEDTRTPLFIQMVVVGVGVGCAVTAYYLLPVQWKTVGVAFAYGIGYWSGFAVSSAILRRRLGGLHGGKILGTYLRAGFAALVGGAAAYGVATGITALLGEHPLAALLATFAGGLVLLGVYVVVARLLRVPELTEILGLVRRRAT